MPGALVAVWAARHNRVKAETAEEHPCHCITLLQMEAAARTLLIRLTVLPARKQSKGEVEILRSVRVGDEGHHQP
jgi:hypothetical protein